MVRDALAGLYEGDEGIGRKVIGQSYLRRRKAPMFVVYAGTAEPTAAFERTLDHGPLDEITV